MLVVTWIGWGLAALALAAMIGAVIAPLLASRDADGLVQTEPAHLEIELLFGLDAPIEKDSDTVVNDPATDDEEFWRAVIRLRLILHERERRGVDTEAARDALRRMCQAFERARVSPHVDPLRRHSARAT